MLRRPPTSIPLTEEDVRFHMKRIFAPVSLDQLSLEDTDYNAAEETMTDHRSSTTTINPRGHFDEHHPLQSSNKSNSGMRRPSMDVAGVARTPPATLTASMQHGSTHQTTTILDPAWTPRTMHSSLSRLAQLISSSHRPQARAARRQESSREHPRTDPTVLTHEAMSRRLMQSPNGKKENRRGSHPQDPWTDLNKHESPSYISQTAKSQSSCLSPGAFPELTMNLVPERDPALAPPNESDEAGLADTTVSPSAADNDTD